MALLGGGFKREACNKEERDGGGSKRVRQGRKPRRSSAHAAVSHRLALPGDGQAGVGSVRAVDAGLDGRSEVVS